jgi:hypothetical protein
MVWVWLLQLRFVIPFPLSSFFSNLSFYHFQAKTSTNAATVALQLCRHKSYTCSHQQHWLAHIHYVRMLLYRHGSFRLDLP